MSNRKDIMSRFNKVNNKKMAEFLEKIDFEIKDHVLSPFSYVVSFDFYNNTEYKLTKSVVFFAYTEEVLKINIQKFMMDYEKTKDDRFFFSLTPSFYVNNDANSLILDKICFNSFKKLDTENNEENRNTYLSSSYYYGTNYKQVIKELKSECKKKDSALLNYLEVKKIMKNDLLSYYNLLNRFVDATNAKKVEKFKKTIEYVIFDKLGYVFCDSQKDFDLLCQGKKELLDKTLNFTLFFDRKENQEEIALYQQFEKDKVITYSSAVNDFLMKKRNNNQLFFAKRELIDLIFDEMVSFISQNNDTISNQFYGLDENKNPFNFKFSFTKDSVYKKSKYYFNKVLEEEIVKLFNYFLNKK